MVLPGLRGDMVAVQPVVRADPQQTVAVFMEATHEAVGRPSGDCGEVLFLWIKPAQLYTAMRPTPNARSRPPRTAKRRQSFMGGGGRFHQMGNARLNKRLDSFPGSLPCSQYNIHPMDASHLTRAARPY